ALTQQLADRLDGDPRFEIVAPHPFALVCFRCTESDEATTRLIEAVNNVGSVAWTGSELNGRPMIRVSIGQRSTEQSHVDGLWDLIDQHA
ncbi:MAG: aspartate aminotransferase family protein, partial [Actinomycetota bacterium]|nr:aspartate aminotransferase family protein [Actinomycetota bacterium]